MATDSSLIAVVTGANKGIGHEIVRRLALEGLTVVLTARDEKRGLDATSSFVEYGLKNVIFHQLDVRDQSSVDSFANIIQTKFGRLDILVNNAGIYSDVEAEECLLTNYYGVKRITEALLPLLKLSKSGAKIINVSSRRSVLKGVMDEETRRELGDLENLTEEKVDTIVKKFLHDVKHETIKANGQSQMTPAYSMSKAVLNAYTRVLAKRYPDIYINCVHPGYVKTDMNGGNGDITIEEGAKGPVMLALLPNGGPSGCYFDQTEKGEF